MEVGLSDVELSTDQDCEEVKSWEENQKTRILQRQTEAGRGTNGICSVKIWTSCTPHTYLYTFVHTHTSPECFVNSSALIMGWSWKAIATETSAWMQLHQLCMSISFTLEGESKLFPPHAPEQSCICNYETEMTVYFLLQSFFKKEKKQQSKTPRCDYFHDGWILFFFLLTIPSFLRVQLTGFECECSPGFLKT